LLCGVCSAAPGVSASVEGGEEEREEEEGGRTMTPSLIEVTDMFSFFFFLLFFYFSYLYSPWKETGLLLELKFTLLSLTFQTTTLDSGVWTKP
jgi:hypothetical protein